MKTQSFTTYSYTVYSPGQLSPSNSLTPVRVLRYSPEEDVPLISALMVTRGDPERVGKSVSMFEKQTWTNKELVIVGDRLNDQAKRIVGESTSNILLVEAPKGLSLGDYRNMSVARSSGEFICQWDDDDLYDNSRLSVMMSALRQSGAEAAFLGRLLIWWQQRDLLFISGKRTWEGSMLAKRSAIGIYPAWPKSEDNAMVGNILNNFKTTILDAPQMYCYCITGDNTWDTDHFERLLKSASHIFSAQEKESIRSRLNCFEYDRPSPPEAM